MTTETGTYESRWREWDYAAEEIVIVSEIDDTQNDAIDATLQQDLGADGVVDNSETVTLSGGMETFSLSSFQAVDEARYAIRLEVESDEDREEDPSVSEAVVAAPEGILSGFVTDEVGTDILDATVRAIDHETDEVVGVTTADERGKYEFEISGGGEFHVVTEFQTADGDFHAKSLPFVEVEPSN